MHTLKTLGSLTALVVLGSIMAMAAGQQVPRFTPEQEARLQIRGVKDGLYVIPGFDGGQSGGNVAVRVTDDGVIIVDNKFPYSFDFINEQVRKVTDQPIKYVLNTHHHDDHSGSNADFLPTAEVIAHKNARANVVRNNQPGPPRVIFADETAVFLGGAEVQMFHFGRGHTNGDAVAYFPDLRTVHTGDLIVFGQRLDGSTLSPFWDFGNGGSVLEWPATLTGLLALDFDTVIPGHGPLLTKDDVRIFRGKMEIVIDRVRTEIAAGATRDDIGSRVDTADLDWPLAPSRFRNVFDELTGAQ
ncbi:MAG: MBL fold metallo-hydrolase [Gemmatimonadota bacterium]|jgi:glyoxylase-like metal-dependent hydrolase (beta-lactamase superfamily II)|nr:MBL fold metallo-hydrolase [Gemmatimonadota bacterium]